jgi:uncharacterized damage-inducible protein DinB
MTTNSLLLQLWQINQAKFNATIDMLNDSNLKKRTNPQTASAAHISRHTAEGQLFLAKVLLNAEIPPFEPKGRGVDEGHDHSIEEIKNLAQQGNQVISKIIEKMPVHKWHEEYDVPHFGKQTAFKGFAMIMNHTAHHCGQIEQAIKKGN